MAITTYAELQSAIADWLNRSDLTSVIPDYITLAEAQMQRDIRHWRMEKRATLTVDARFSAVPDDFLAPLRIHVTASGYQAPMDLISIDDMQERRGGADDAAGVPGTYAIVGGEFEFYPTPDGSYTAELHYRRTIPALSDTNVSNWLLSLAPDAYLYASLMQSAPYLQEDARAMMWAEAYNRIVASINLEGKRGKHGGTGRKMRIR